MAQDNKFSTLHQAMVDVAIELDEADNITFTQGDVASLLGQKIDLGMSFLKLLHPKDHPLHSLMRSKLARKSKIGPAPLRLLKPDGEEIAVEVFCASLKRGGKLVIQMSLTAYKSDLVFPSAHSRPVSSAHRIFKSEHFSKFATKLNEYAVTMDTDAPGALLKLSGFDDKTTGKDIETSLWILCRLLNDSANEGAGYDRVVAQAEKHETPPEYQTGKKKTVLSAMQDAYEVEKGEVNYVTVAGSSGLSESESVKAAVYSMQKASETARSATVKGLTDYEVRFKKTKQQMKAFKQIVVQEHFDIALQPIVDIKSGKVHHFEALARFDPKFYSGSPFEFMCFAEEVGVIPEFDLAMMLKVIYLIKRLKRIGYDASVAVNISGKSIQSPAFLRHFFRILEDCGDIRSNLIFELTESSQIDDLQATNRILSRIREFGHKVCLDDFGAGAAGIQYLHALKVDCVKIDGIYIRKGIENGENKSFLKSMADLCNELGVETVGECVENEAQRDFLEEIGVTYAQGWLYGKPVPFDEALELL